MVTHTRRVPGGPGEAEAAMKARERADGPLGPPPGRRTERSIVGKGTLAEAERSGGDSWRIPTGTARVSEVAASPADGWWSQ